MIILYGVGQSRSFRALWALEEAEIEYHYQEVKFGSSDADGTSNETYRTLNYQGKVPTLVDNALVITESAAIVNYIAALNPSLALMPNDDRALRARYDQIAFFVLSDLEQPLWTNGKHRFVLPAEQRIDAVFEVTHWEFEQSLRALQALLNGQQYAVGEAFTMADILIAHTLQWAENFKFTIPTELLSYRDALYHRPACQRALLKIAAQ